MYEMKPKFKPGDKLRYGLGVVKHGFVFEDYIVMYFVERDDKLYLASHAYYIRTIEIKDEIDKFSNGDIRFRQKIEAILNDKFWTHREAIARYGSNTLVFWRGQKKLKLDLFVVVENGKNVYEFKIDYLESF